MAGKGGGGCIAFPLSSSRGGFPVEAEATSFFGFKNLCHYPIPCPSSGNWGVPAMKTKGEIEAEISEAMVNFEIEYMGRGPKEARTYIIEDMVLVRLKGVLTPAEQQLTKSKDGMDLIKKMRSTLIESARAHLSQVLADITGTKVLGLHTDISTVSGERVIVFTLDRDLEKTLPRKKSS